MTGVLSNIGEQQQDTRNANPSLLPFHNHHPHDHHQAHSFELETDTTKFGAYTRGGIVTQHKEPKTLAFKKLADALEEPGEFLLSDFSKIERSPLLHLAFQALDAYQVLGLCWLVCVGVVEGCCWLG